VKVLNIIDVPDWAFFHNCKALEKYGANEYTIRFGRGNKYKDAFKKLRKFDLVLYWTDARPDYLVKRKVPNNKIVAMIRSDVRKTCKKGRFKYWQETKLVSGYIKCFMAANRDLLKWVRKKYPAKKAFYAPGGVDTEMFQYTPKEFKKTPVVGWAGSKKNFGADIRGLRIIEDAVKQLGWDYKPAYRESKWRSQQQMAEYYKTIDLYIDMYSAPGRQNGLLEAGACGVPLVCCDKGIARELVPGGLQIAQRNVESVKAALQRAWRHRAKTSPKIASLVAKEWSWKLWTEKYEEIFEQIVRI